MSTRTISVLMLLAWWVLSPCAYADTTVQWGYGNQNYPTEAAAVAAMHAVSPQNALLTVPAGEAGVVNGAIKYKWVAPNPLAPTQNTWYWAGGPAFPTEEQAVDMGVNHFYGNTNVAACGAISWMPTGPWVPGNLGSPAWQPGYTRNYLVTVNYAMVDGAGNITGCFVGHPPYDAEKWTTYNCPAYYNLQTNGSGDPSSDTCVDTDSDYVSATPLFPPRCPAGQPPNKSQSSVCGDPIDTATGDFWHTEPDYSSPVLSFSRSYHSANLGGVHGLGVGWTHQYAARVLKAASGQPVGLVRPDGHQDILVPMATSYFYESTSGDGLHVTTYASGTEYIADLPDGSSEIYDPNGNLIQIVNAAQQVTTLNYANGLLSSVVGPFGHTLQFTYNANNQIAQVTDPAGLAITYSYDANNNLISVQYQDGSTRSYQYTNSSFPNSLTSITDENAAVLTSITYDASGRAISSVEAGGANATSVVYGSSTATVTDSLSSTTVLSFAANAGYPVVVNSVSQNGLTRTYVVPAPSTDVQQRATQMTDERGVVTSYVYDEAHLTSKTEASGTAAARTISYQFASAGNELPTLITEPLKKTAYTYAAGANVVTSKSVTDLASGAVRKWTYTYDSNNRVQTVDGPRTDVSDLVSYTYYTCTTGAQCGQLQTVTDALGHTTTNNTYNAHGQPLTITDANGVVITLTYDLRQRVTSRQVGSETTTFSYWPTGLLQRVTLQDNSYLQYAYDNAHRLVQITDGAGNKIAYTLDAAGNRIATNTTDSSGALHRTHSQVFNTLNQLSQDINAAGTSAVTTTYGYDAYGNQASIAAPLGRNTANVYDPLNRLSQVTDPASGITQFGYNANDNLTSVVDPRALTISYSYSGFGDLLSQSSPDTGSTTNSYDTAGNLATVTDARAAVATYSYDALNRPTSVAYQVGGSNDQTIAFSYDAGTNGIGHLTGASDVNHSLGWTYDTLGRVTGKTQIVGSVSAAVSYGYTNGDLTSLTTPAGRAVTYGYNDNHQITSVAVNGTTIVSGITYEPFGAVNGWTWGNGTAAIRTFDTDGAISSVSSSMSRSYSYDDAQRIAGIADNADSARSWVYGYDALDRITTAGSATQSESFTYDANGNRLSQLGTLNATYAVASSSNRLSTASGGISRTYSYDAAGHTIGYGGFTLTYNGAGRLSAISGSSGLSTYIYNALGQRVKKTTPSGSTVFVYDEVGHLLGEYDGSGSAIQEVVWLGDIPIASIRQEACGLSIFYIHTDHLNTPRRITRRSTSDVVWSWDSDPFGLTAAKENPSGLGTFSFNLRLPGQYYDAETGLNYNYYRDYDPATGRYVESDPIGLDGGSMSTYSYVNDDPLDYIDPEGLAGSGAPRRRVRDCNSDESTQCEAQCAGKGVRSCKRQQLFTPVRTTNRNGTVLTTWVWKDQGLSCDCKDPEACKNAIQKAAQALGLSVTTYLILSEGSRLFPPRNLVPVP